MSVFMEYDYRYGTVIRSVLSPKIEASPLIIEGKVVEQKCFRTKTGDIYTANKVQLSGILKGTYPKDVVTITTWGGELDGELQTWTHLLTLQTGQQGIFFLEPTRVEAINHPDFPASFDVYAGVQGFLARAVSDTKAVYYHEPFHSYYDVATEVFAPIAKQAGQPYQSVAGAEKKKSGIRFHFTDISFDGTAVNFKIYVNSLEGEKKLYRSGVVMNYNAEFFGESVAANNALQLTEQGISAPVAYTLARQDLSAEKVQITCNFSGNLTNLITINTNESLLGTGKLFVQNVAAEPDISFNYSEILALNQFWDNGSPVTFDTVIVDGEWKPFGNVVTITSVSPLIVAAGIDQIITITGYGFGTSPDGVLPPSTKRVLFTPAPEVFPSTYYWSLPIRSLTQYVSWSDTEIKVRVPSTGRDLDNPSYMGGLVDASACSEFIGILDLSTTPPPIITSPDPIYVKYSAVNQAYSLSGNEHVAKVKLADRNSDGGYDLYYTPQFATLNSGSGVSAFERALITWRCNTLVNFRIKNFTSTPPTNACKIDYGPLPAGVPSATKAATPLGAIDVCGTSVGSNFFYLTKFDMVFSNGATWHSEISQPTLNWNTNFDLETVALHELGHAHLLWHTNNPANVMHGLASGYKRVLTADDLEGGNYIVTYSTSTASPPCTTYMYMTAISLSECSTVGIQDVQHLEDFFLINPNPASEEFTIQAKENHIGLVAEGVQIYNVAGQLIKAIDLTDNNVAIQIQELSSGTYIIVLRSKGKSFAGKLTKH